MYVCLCMCMSVCLRMWLPVCMCMFLSVCLCTDHFSYALHQKTAGPAISLIWYLLYCLFARVRWVWVLPYIPVHQQCQSQPIDFLTEMTKEHFKLFVLIDRSQNMQKKIILRLLSVCMHTTSLWFLLLGESTFIALWEQKRRHLFQRY